MRIKHSKYRNTGLIFELLVKQIAADTLSQKDSPAVSILKKFFTGKSLLGKEYRLYEAILKNRGVGSVKAESILSTISEISRKLDRQTLKNQKYSLIKEIRKHYDLDEFFSIKIREYKPLAATYCLLEAQNIPDLVDPQILIDNRLTILEHLTEQKQDAEEIRDSIVEEYSKLDKDLKLLAYRVLLNKFNDKYKDLLPEQKNILREFLTSASSQTRLRNLVNTELGRILEIVKRERAKVDDDITRIKLNEIIKEIKPLSNRDRITDAHLISLMQYYELVQELQILPKP